MRKLPELYLVREPEAAAASNVVYISAIRSHGLADLHSVGRSWPLQRAWRDLVHSLMRKPRHE